MGEWSPGQGGREVDSQSLFFEGVRGVVGSEAVDHVEVGPQGVEVFLRGEAWADFKTPLAPTLPSPIFSENRGGGCEE